MARSAWRVLGIESSCDEMAAAVVVDDGRHWVVESSVVHAQTDVHAPYGGVVPELASRDHVLAVSGVVARALAEAGAVAGDVDGVAVTAGPGLVGSLLVGLSFAKGLAYRLRIPIVGVHHLVGHLMSAELADASLAPPYLGLVVSGGHTALYRVPERGEPALLGQTRDDAVGEAFDKVAKLLGLAYPGGPAVSRAARDGARDAVAFPRPMQGEPGYDFSYSGLKTAVALELQRRRAAAGVGPDDALPARDVADVAASFEAAAVAPLVARTARACAAQEIGTVAVVGGVAANAHLREEMARAGAAHGFRTVFPPLGLCTDNAAMIAAAGARLLARGVRDDLALNAFSRVPVGQAPWRDAEGAAGPVGAEGAAGPVGGQGAAARADGAAP
ncbi:MAG: tRNA (adenosine(37)-N6)-threonylcarbamoyltransferase complex transferase subunit TsaD [Myxococcota bacterium]